MPASMRWLSFLLHPKPLGAKTLVDREVTVRCSATSVIGLEIYDGVGAIRHHVHLAIPLGCKCYSIATNDIGAPSKLPLV